MGWGWMETDFMVWWEPLLLFQKWWKSICSSTSTCWKNTGPSVHKTNSKTSRWWNMVWGCFARAGVGDWCKLKAPWTRKVTVKCFKNTCCLLHIVSLVTILFFNKTMPQGVKCYRVLCWSYPRLLERRRMCQVIWHPRMTSAISWFVNHWKPLGQSWGRFKGSQSASKNTMELFEEVKYSWEHLSTTYIEHVADSMIQQYRKVIANKGFHINYRLPGLTHANSCFNGP